MKLILFINGKQQNGCITRLNFKSDNLFQRKLNLAIGLMKIEKEWRMRGNDWEIFLIHKSKLK